MTQHWATQHWATQHWATNHFFGLGVVVVQQEFGGRQFVGFIPLTEMLRRQIPVDAKVVQFTQETETEFIIEGKTYELVAKRTPKEIIESVPNIDAVLDDASQKMGISRRKAKKELYNLIIEELSRAEAIKESVFTDDEEIIMILVATDEI